MNPLTGFVGAVVEAWGELKVGKTRVLMSLIGVAVAVAALTGVVALGQIATQATVENYERQSGRPAMLSVYVYQSGEYDPSAIADTGATTTAFREAMQRYGVGYSSVVSSAAVPWTVPTGSGPQQVNPTGVDVPYAAMHRLELQEGRWFEDSDASRLAPAVVVNAWLWEQLGSPPLDTHPVLTDLGPDGITAVVVGVLPSGPYEEWPQVWTLNDAFPLFDRPDPQSGITPQYEAWVPPDQADALTTAIRSDIASVLGDGWQADVQRNDYLAYGGADPLLPLQLGVGGVALLVLLLGALGLLNISLVTVRYRIREIGIRRSFGATAGRVFFSVMMESVVATAAAGVVGVMIAILVVQSPWVQDLISQGVQDLPPFPLSAAVAGLGAATVVGALAGLLPALVAVRVKVIDAIRY